MKYSELARLQKNLEKLQDTDGYFKELEKFRTAFTTFIYKADLKKLTAKQIFNLNVWCGRYRPMKLFSYLLQFQMTQSIK